VHEDRYEAFIEDATKRFKEEFKRAPKVYEVVISDGARRLL
jgi:galactokinase